jgi:hypothetical protein
MKRTEETKRVLLPVADRFPEDEIIVPTWLAIIANWAI